MVNLNKELMTIIAVMDVQYVGKVKVKKKIRKFLKENNIKYYFQYSFYDCRSANPLPFYFYLPDLNICIEYNGIQHYKPVKTFGGKDAFKEQIKRDKIKKKYCKNNKIKLIEIEYNEDVFVKLEKKINYAKKKTPKK